MNRLILSLLTLALCAGAQSERRATEEEGREQECAQARQKCLDRIMPKIEDEREACQRKVDSITTSTKLQVVLATGVMLLSKGRATPILTLVGAADTHESKRREIETARRSSEDRIRGLLDGCQASERCSAQAAGFRLDRVAACLVALGSGLFLMWRAL
jgi:hypothetical protein